MRKHRTWTGRFLPAISILLSAALCMTGMQVYAGEPAQITKEEVVYSSMKPDGQVKEIYVVNAFDMPQDGTITDYGDYALLENLTDMGELHYTGDKVSVDARKGRFYYQGNMTGKNLPWVIEITYTLDGKAVPAEKLGGASGKIGIEIDTRQNPEADKIFYEKYMLQVTITLDTSISRNIKAEDAVLANAGSDKQITFTVMPETVGKMRISTDADTFSMSGISIAAVPFSAGADMIDIGEIDRLTDGLNQLSQGVTELDSGAKQLKNGASALHGGTAELKSGVNEFNQGIGRLKEGAESISSGAGLLQSGSGEFQEGLNQMASLSDELLNGSGEINQALQMLKAGVQDLGNLDLTPLKELPGGLDSLAGALEQVQTGYAGLFQVMDQVIAQYPMQDVTAEELYAASEELKGTSPETQAVFGKLVNNYTAAMAVIGTYQGIKQNLEQLQGGMTEMVQNLRGMSTQLGALDGMDPEGLKTLSDGMTQLAGQYAGFHEGLSQYMDGVKSLAGGYAEIHSGIGSLAEGTAGLSGGISQTADGASGLLGGVNSLDDGAKELSDGAAQLSGGLDTLNESTAKLPEEIRKGIDEMLDKYTNNDFKPVSFTSVKNRNVGAVQFVLSTEGISRPETEKPETEDTKKESAWEKFINLFR